ncbi:hypothetical protein Desor_5096 [Desulfosporosinus orientis DSM 765]|uniref:DUF5658 domain-containing protein n=2 Tax=Desulfosporosinus orientis TaxID=1563 RepID=G7WJQ0_DESOD|nr:hypothetical protein Desor_5096 [Desulfosporosinus orientis DSM 765]
MATLTETSPNYLRAFKVLLPIVLGAACWRTRNKSQQLIVIGLGLLMFVYSWILLMHVYWLCSFVIFRI